MKYYLADRDEVFRNVKSGENGLTDSQAEARLRENGKNKLAEEKKDSLFKRFLQQLSEPMTVILIAAAIVSAVTAAYAHESYADVVIIMIVVLVNAVLGVYQENKAEKAIESLREMAAATSKVLRGGSAAVVKSEDLVVGDVVLLEAGDVVPADCRILESASLKIEEAALTGESVPAGKTDEPLSLNGAKEIPLGDRKNMAYMGSTVVYGRGKAVVTAAGMDTEMGKIADAIARAKQSLTPLQIKLKQLSRILTYLVVGICVFMFAFSLMKEGNFSGPTILNTFMVAVSLAVAAIPEGLATVVTIVLAIGVTNMSRRNAVIRRLTAVETLGCAQIICSDKTGTLTQNRMTVVKHFGGDETRLATALALCSDSELSRDGKVTGEPTENALVHYADSLSLKKYDLSREAPRVGEAPFDSARKMMSTVHKDGQRFVQYTKGAPDVLLKQCTHILRNGEAVPLTDKLRAEVLSENKRMADKALRVLGAAYKTYGRIPPSFAPDRLEQGLTFLGLVGMIDPIRPEVVGAIEKCKAAGIRVIMITGDHKDTAAAIARQLGILTDDSQAITGSQLNDLSDEEFGRSLESYSVYARVQPEHKVRIVNAWKKKGMVTAMTGDGVNDAPSIKNADIGVGMGITGTEVTKNVADMVLADDNFATIVSAVEEGRRIYDNIRKTIQYLLASNLSEVISVFVATLLGFTILKPVHLLWINLITDCFPALALGMERQESNLMARRPRNPKDGIFAGGLGTDVAYQGVLVSLVTLAAYFIGHFMEAGRWEITASSDGMTMAFLTMSMAEIFHSFNMRSQRGSIFTMNYQNRFLLCAMVGSLLLTTAVIYIPALSFAFGFEEISAAEYGTALALAFSVIPIVEAVKAVQRRRKAVRTGRT
ncbi:MAG: calcium-translocating P-type ATPase, PMCA-type [Oscillospiraceae bacterium]|jgi:Ca2+-transporting ATPase|nr:calcium-translocating P-type ATPase, PMCA-type [Oscillospiraceae bacterium]MCI1989993.1 calcium-translocating P-type ATPase, PMCA-type [Oscillospiraceae bacterium]MCI2034835.1 calcium-translocating P-type ATPase, PMCA-type [Oscillospiraceae bacterium]